MWKLFQTLKFLDKFAQELLLVGGNDLADEAKGYVDASTGVP